jgi:copper(I)-binding protein
MTPRSFPRLLSALLAGLLATVAAQANEADHVRADKAWIRVLPGDLPAAGYVRLHNDGEQPATLRTAASPRYGSVMLHRSSGEGGMSRMTMVDGIVIPAHGETALAPGGYHLMLMQPTAPVQAGEHIPMNLRFADGSTLAVDFIARPANAADAEPPMTMDHGTQSSH